MQELNFYSEEVKTNYLAWKHRFLLTQICYQGYFTHIDMIRFHFYDDYWISVQLTEPYSLQLSEDVLLRRDFD